MSVTAAGAPDIAQPALPVRSRWGGANWHYYSRNPLSMFGLVLLVLVVLAAAFAPWVTPFPSHAGAVVDFANARLAPSGHNWFGTDLAGRDIFTRVIFAYRISLEIGIVVLVIAVPIGVAAGLVAGYYGGWIEAVVMRVTDVFLSIPPLVLAMAILGVLPPTLENAMLAIAAMWWPWYARLVYSIVRTLRGEPYVVAARVVGASDWHILFREILPNCTSSLLTKITLDLGFVILIAASLGFLGLGVQAPTPELGAMVAEGANNLPDLWWMSLFPGLAILVVVLAFNLVGDGLKDMLGAET